MLPAKRMAAQHAGIPKMSFSVSVSLFSILLAVLPLFADTDHCPVHSPPYLLSLLLMRPTADLWSHGEATPSLPYTPSLFPPYLLIHLLVRPTADLCSHKEAPLLTLNPPSLFPTHPPYLHLLLMLPSAALCSHGEPPPRTALIPYSPPFSYIFSDIS